MKIPANLHCLFTGTVTADEDGVVIRLPREEIDNGTLDPESVYRFVVLDALTVPEATEPAASSQEEPPKERSTPDAPVEEGEQIDVEIESVGDEGDGIARVERGYVIIVPDTEVAERVTVEITDVTPTVGFAEVVERHHPVFE